jgi:integrase/recombinase XerD
VAQYLRHAIALFRKRHGRPPGPYRHSIPRSGIHALLRLAQGQWPPAPRVTCAADAVRFTICGEYETWLREERGLVRPSIVALLWEARHFLAWQLGRCGAESLTDLNVGDLQRLIAEEVKESLTLDYKQSLARGTTDQPKDDLCNSLC